VDDSGAIGLVGILLIVALGGTAATGIGLYVADFGLTANVRDTECSVPLVTVQTEIGDIEHDVTTISADQCLKLAPGDHAVYHIRTQRTTIYRGGVCFYDTETGTLCGQAPVPPTQPGGLGLL
jgi:hypothetical protein